MNLAQPRQEAPISVTVIVPVYNAERFLNQCIESILGQTYKDLRLILVDDESSDGSGDICDTHAVRDARVMVMHQKNAGPASARNAAIDRLDSTGYVMFVDADDYLAPGAIARCVEALETHGADMVVCNFASVVGDGKDITENRMELSGDLSMEEIVRFIDGVNDLRRSAFLGPLWRRLLKCSLISEHGLKLPAGIYLAEDIGFMADYLVRCRSIFALDEVLYFKRMHGGNLSTGFERIPVDAMIRGYEAYKTLLEQASPEDNRKLDRQFMDDMIGSIVKLFHPRLGFSEGDKVDKIGRIVNYPRFNTLMKTHRTASGHSRMLAFAIRLRCFPLIKLVARTRAKRRYPAD